ncbi:hypothetical protein M0Q97_10100, partial [Candidatus Dojkabacteria bacterium]|nr:hypothetical protein [Candidatus Dojkabacteria bacterium]
MKIYSSIGSKERLVEMFQRVNNIQLNENFNGTSNEIVENAFNLLRNNQLKILNTNKQTGDNESYVELNCIDKSGTNINFKFRVTSSQGELEGVFKMDGAELIDFTQGKSDGSNTFSVDENMLKQFNSQYKNALIDIVSNYVDFDEDKPESDELYEVAVKIIDNVQCNSGERLQKHRTYADEKPTNSNVMVNSSVFEENDKLEPEGQDDDPLAMPNNYDDNELDKDLENSYDDVDKSYMGTLDVGDDADESTPEEQELYNQAFENLMAKNKTSKNLNYYPTRPEIEREVERLEGTNKPQEPEDPYSHMAKGKKRVYPAWADKYLTENPDYAGDVQNKYYNNISPAV